MINIELFGVVSAILVASAFAPYLHSIYKGHARPHVYSWAIWSITQGTGALVMLSEGAAWGAAGVTIGTLLCMSVAISSLWRGTKNIRRIDALFLAGALLAFSLYVFVHELYASLALVIFIDVSGFGPTLRKVIADPRSELATTWALFALSNVFSLAALPVITVLTAAYPIALLICEVSLTGILLLLRWQKRR